MTHELPTRQRRWRFCAVLPMFLAACQPTPGEVAAPPPPATNEVAAALCSVWLRTLPTWADEDTETTKDQIDYAIRSQEAACVSAAR